ncbi:MULTISPECIES: alpha/beta fold hydrolase [unclassified Halomonas]|uniref:alpha/beta fold hydrolase n=1 Tax=unclassified Halomonas TaxID=2609666 RepID=UPI00207681D3|nr:MULTISPECIES: alpha/beta fold hydrolase [unclassified Halomonas]
MSDTVYYVTSNQSTIGYRLQGEGAPLVLLHGTGGDGEANWSGVVPYLINRQLMRPDYPGSGLSAPSLGALDLDTLVHSVMAAVDDAGFECFDLAGFSLGAALALRLAKRFPGRVKRLALVNGFAHAQDARSVEQFSLWHRLAMHDRPALAGLILLTGFSADFIADLSHEELRQMREAIVTNTCWPAMIQQIALDMTLDVTPDLAFIDHPTLVLGSRLDHMVAPSASRFLAKRLSRSWLEWLDCAHLAPMEAPDRVAKALAGFLDAPAR